MSEKAAVQKLIYNTLLEKGPMTSADLASKLKFQLGPWAERKELSLLLREMREEGFMIGKEEGKWIAKHTINWLPPFPPNGVIGNGVIGSSVEIAAGTDKPESPDDLGPEIEAALEEMRSRLDPDVQDVPRKIGVLNRLAGIVHPELAVVLDDIRQDYLAHFVRQ